MTSSRETASGEERPPTRVTLAWTGRALVFEGGAEGGPRVTVDSAASEGASPMSMLLLSLAGCMGIDVVAILEKSRVPLKTLVVDVEGDRAAEAPRRFHRIRMVYRLAGPGAEHRARVERAVELSRDRYCSVLHSLRTDIDIDLRIEPA